MNFVEKGSQIQSRSVANDNTHSTIHQRTNNKSVVQRYGIGDLPATAAALAGGVVGFMGGGIPGAIGLASAGAYAADKARKAINDYRNQNTGCTVSVLTTGGVTRDFKRKWEGATGGYRDGGSNRAVAKSAVGSFGLATGHVSIQLSGPLGIETYDVQGDGIHRINNVTGSTRETHKITVAQYHTILNQITADRQGRIRHTLFDFNLVRANFGIQAANTASCAGWVIGLLRKANVPAGTLFDRYIFPIPKAMAASGLD